MRYNLGDFIDTLNDELFIKEYRSYFRGLSNDRKADLFEQLVLTPKDQLARIRLEYAPKTTTHHASFYVIPTNPINRVYVIYKVPTSNPVAYMVG